MSFVFSKLLWSVLAPLNLILILLLAGLITGWKHKAGKAMMIGAVSVFFIGGVTPVGHNLLVDIENYHDRPAVLPETIDGIIVLGGALDPGLSRRHGVPALNQAAERILECVYLSKKFPGVRLIYTGGEGSLNPVGEPETKFIEIFMDRYGFDSMPLIYEDRARNTYENAQFTKALIHPGSEQTWLLVTSAYHMPRAVAAFKSAGWRNILPWPVDYHTQGHHVWRPSLDVSGNFLHLKTVWHETLGVIYYVLTDKISLHNL